MRARSLAVVCLLVCVVAVLGWRSCSAVPPTPETAESSGGERGAARSAVSPPARPPRADPVVPVTAAPARSAITGTVQFAVPPSSGAASRARLRCVFKDREAFHGQVEPGAVVVAAEVAPEEPWTLELDVSGHRTLRRPVVGPSFGTVHLVPAVEYRGLIENVTEAHGMLQARLKSKAGQPLTQWVTVDPSGAFRIDAGAQSIPTTLILRPDVNSGVTIEFQAARCGFDPVPVAAEGLTGVHRVRINATEPLVFVFVDGAGVPLGNTVATVRDVRSADPDWSAARVTTDADGRATFHGIPASAACVGHVERGERPVWFRSVPSDPVPFGPRTVVIEAAPQVCLFRLVDAGDSPLRTQARLHVFVQVTGAQSVSAEGEVDQSSGMVELAVAGGLPPEEQHGFWQVSWTDAAGFRRVAEGGLDECRRDPDGAWRIPCVEFSQAEQELDVRCPRLPNESIGRVYVAVRRPSGVTEIVAPPQVRAPGSAVTDHDVVRISIDPAACDIAAPGTQLIARWSDGQLSAVALDAGSIPSGPVVMPAPGARPAFAVSVVGADEASSVEFALVPVNVRGADVMTTTWAGRTKSWCPGDWMLPGLEYRLVARDLSRGTIGASAVFQAAQPPSHLEAPLRAATTFRSTVRLGGPWETAKVRVQVLPLVPSIGTVPPVLFDAAAGTVTAEGVAAGAAVLTISGTLADGRTFSVRVSADACDGRVVRIAGEPATATIE